MNDNSDMSALNVSSEDEDSDIFCDSDIHGDPPGSLASEIPGRSRDAALNSDIVDVGHEKKSLKRNQSVLQRMQHITMQNTLFR